MPLSLLPTPLPPGLILPSLLLLTVKAVPTPLGLAEYPVYGDYSMVPQYSYQDDPPPNYGLFDRTSGYQARNYYPAYTNVDTLDEGGGRLPSFSDNLPKGAGTNQRVEEGIVFSETADHGGSRQSGQRETKVPSPTWFQPSPTWYDGRRPDGTTEAGAPKQPGQWKIKEPSPTWLEPSPTWFDGRRAEETAQSFKETSAVGGLRQPAQWGNNDRLGLGVKKASVAGPLFSQLPLVAPEYGPTKNTEIQKQRPIFLCHGWVGGWEPCDQGMPSSSQVKYSNGDPIQTGFTKIKISSANKVFNLKRHHPNV